MTIRAFTRVLCLLFGLGLAAPVYAQDTSTVGVGLVGPGGPGGLGDVLKSRFSIEADRFEAARSTETYVATGHVQIRRPGAVLYADKVTFDAKAGLAHAQGSVVAVDGASVVTCDKVTMRIPELYGGIRNAELRIKRKGSVTDLDMLSPAEAREAGRNELIIQANQLNRSSASEVRVTGATFTACDCGDGNRPSWRIWSADASIDLNSGAWLTLPVFYVLDVPVMALPILYVPLGARRSGLLTPHFGLNPNTGVRVGLPLYLALSRSWDVTVEPIYLAERGAALDLELRYAPTTQTRGGWRPSVVADFGALQIDGNGWEKGDTPLYRWALAGEHVTQWSQSNLRAGINAVGDPAYLGAFANAFLTRQAEYTQSRVIYGRTLGDTLRLSGGLQLLQDMRSDTYAGSYDTALRLRSADLFSGQVARSDSALSTGALLTGAGTVRYRFADLVFDLAPTTLIDAFGLLGQARLVVSTFAAPRPEIGRFVRADFRPELSAALDLPWGLVLEPSMVGRLSAWAGRADSQNVDALRLFAMSRTRLFMELSRDFGALTHRIRPTVEHVLLPKLYGSGALATALNTEDEVDGIQAMHQVRARVQTELLSSSSGQTIAGLDTWLGRDLAHQGREATNSEWVTKMALHLGQDKLPFRFDLFGMAALRLHDRVVTEARATARIADGLGDSLSVTWARFDTVRPQYTQVGSEELVPSGVVRSDQYLSYQDWRVLPPEVPAPSATPWDGRMRQDYRPWSGHTGLIIGARAHPIKPLTLGFDMTLAFEDDSVKAERPNPSIFTIVRATAGWVSPCECWSLYLTVTKARDLARPTLGFGLDLAQLGSVTN